MRSARLAEARGFDMSLSTLHRHYRRLRIRTESTIDELALRPPLKLAFTAAKGSIRAVVCIHPFRLFYSIRESNSRRRKQWKG